MPALASTGKASRSVPKRPLTEAAGQRTGEMAVLPGTRVYHAWAENLRNGQISYDEFVEWVGARPQLSLWGKLREFLRSSRGRR
jgi:hypothetical protein